MACKVLGNSRKRSCELRLPVAGIPCKIQFSFLKSCLRHRFDGQALRISPQRREDTKKYDDLNEPLYNARCSSQLHVPSGSPLDNKIKQGRLKDAALALDFVQQTPAGAPPFIPALTVSP
jgi:hypothetical protein